jgi:hypothetical protein
VKKQLDENADLKGEHEAHQPLDDCEIFSEVRELSLKTRSRFRSIGLPPDPIACRLTESLGHCFSL